MREIEFRAKNGNGDWIYGDLLHNTHDCKYAIRINNNTTSHNEIWKIEPETIGQYTGLKDKNGNKIFEGDIVRQQTFGKLNSSYKSDKDKKDHKKYLIKKCKCIFDDDDNYHRNYDWIVEYENGRFYPFADDNFEWGNYNWNIPVEIIGNVYDNPELSEAK